MRGVRGRKSSISIRIGEFRVMVNRELGEPGTVPVELPEWRPASVHILHLAAPYPKHRLAALHLFCLSINLVFVADKRC